MVTIDWTTPTVSLRFLAEDDGPLRLVEISASAELGATPEPTATGAPTSRWSR